MTPLSNRRSRSLAIAAFMALCAMPAFAQTPLPLALITITGEGRVEARPDMATITIGVTTQGGTAAAAMTQNSAQLGTVLDNLRAAGIADGDLQTSNLSLNPNWVSTPQGAAEIKGYVASNQLTVRVRALEALGTVLDAAVKDGANTLNGISFALADPAPALNEARKRAVADARAKAELLAQAAGVGLGPVQSISESGGMGPQPMFKTERMAMADAVPVAEGEVSMQASVTVVWQIVQ